MNVHLTATFTQRIVDTRDGKEAAAAVQVHDIAVKQSIPAARTHALGVEMFREQVPVVDPDDRVAPTYRTHRLNANVQLWFLEGRDYRTAHSVPDGPGKTLWGEAQREWLKRTLLESDAVFRIIVSPTPLVGPDEPRYARVAVEMSRSGDLVTPTLQGTPWLEKPILYYWLAAGVFTVTGPGRSSLAAPPAGWSFTVNSSAWLYPSLM